MKFFLLFIIFVFTFSVFGQKEENFACSKKDKETVREFFHDQPLYNQILSKFYNVLNSQNPRLPFCWQSCVVSLVKPPYPKVAKENNIFGRVEVNTIADENGKVTFAKAVKGSLVLQRNAELAACHSKFIRIMFNHKPIKFRWRIVYNFLN